MPTATEFRYPDETSPTASWLPADDWRERTELPLRGIVTQATGDPLKTHRYEMGRRAREWELTFDFVTSAKDDELATFEQAVHGNSFRVWDSYKSAWRTAVIVGDITRTNVLPSWVSVRIRLREVEA